MPHPKIDKQVSEIVGGTLFSHVIYSYICHACGKIHTTKENAEEVCFQETTRREENKNLKLFVWEGVLSDWSDGIMFALAHDVDEAKRVIFEKYKLTYGENKYVKIELETEPQVFDSPVGFYLYGGG